MWRRLGVGGLALALLAGCTSETAPPGPVALGESAGALATFGSCDDLLGWFRSEATERVGAYGLESSSGGVGFTMVSGTIEDGVARESAGVDGAAPTTVSPAAGDELAYTGGDAGTGTNVQEVGVDEPDMVKSDGRLFLTLVDGTLRVHTLVDGIPRPAGTMTLTGASSMFLDGDRVLVIGSGAGGPMPLAGDPALSSSYSPYGGDTTLTVVDVSDPTAPRVSATRTVEGSLVDARLVDGTARVVVTSAPDDLGFVYPAGSGAAEERAEAANRAVIESSTLEDWLPSVRTGDAGGDGEPLLDCTRVAVPAEFSGFGTLSVLGIDLDGSGLGDLSATGVVGSGETVYASAGTLYVTTTAWPEVPTGPTPEPQPAPGPAVDPEAPVSSDDVAVAPPVWAPRTALHAFDIATAGPATWLASGQVDGTVLDQYALDEHDGVLRVATTRSTMNGGSESQVVTLTRQGEQLTQVGQVGGLGRGEQIRSVRFLDDVGYVVTFRQVDPLYTIDLRDPARPAVVGELKIPGYSAYLHPVGDGLLLGVGQDADLTGRTSGLKVSLFDVAGPAAPAELAVWVVPGAESAVEFDPHAFLWWAASGYAVIPVQSWSDPANPSRAQVVRISREGIEALAAIAHDPTEPAVVPPPSDDPAPDDTTPDPTTPGTTPPGTTPDDTTPDDTTPDSTTPDTTTPDTTTPDGPVPAPPPEEGRVAPTTTVVSGQTEPGFPGVDVGEPFPGVVPDRYLPTATMLRSLVVGDHLVTVSTAGIALHRLDDLSRVAWIPFS